MAVVRLLKLNRDNIVSWGKLLYDFLRQQDPKDYNDYLLPLSGSERDYNAFAYKLASLVSDQDLALNDGRVPTDYWLVLAGNTIIGTAKTRYLLDEKLVHEGGHIRLGLDKRFRGQGYGSEALKLLIEECKRNHKLHDIMLTTRDSNEAAIHLIEGHGGEWTAEVDSFFYPRKVSIYWIHLPIPKDSVA